MKRIPVPTAVSKRLWSSLASAFVWDGSLRDVIIRDCTIEDWLELFDSLSRKDQITLDYPSFDGDFWSNPTFVCSRYRGQAIVVNKNDVRLKCDIISPELIEFDLDPRQIANQATLDDLISLMSLMSSILKKPVFLTETGDLDAVLFDVQPPSTS